MFCYSPAENQFDLVMAYKVVFSLVIPVGKTLSIMNPTDDTLSSLSNLRKSRWRPRGQAYRESACSGTWFTQKICKMDSFPSNSCLHYPFFHLLINLDLYINKVSKMVSKIAAKTQLCLRF